MRNLVEHTFDPIYDAKSRILLLGTIPSPKSRETGFYYSNPQNRFWKVMSDLFVTDIPASINEKKAFLINHQIALWDVLKSCEITGADDASIKQPVANDLQLILNHADIKAIFATGRKAAALYDKFCLPKTGFLCYRLPSTSPANCGCAYADLLREYGAILKYLP